VLVYVVNLGEVHARGQLYRVVVHEHRHAHELQRARARQHQRAHLQNVVFHVCLNHQHAGA
jgi:predicted nucleic acid-binding protein